MQNEITEKLQQVIRQIANIECKQYACTEMPLIAGMLSAVIDTLPKSEANELHIKSFVKMFEENLAKMNQSV